MIRFASLRFDNALGEDRSESTRALASGDTSIACWRTIASRTYAIARIAGAFDARALAAAGARVDEPPVNALYIKPFAIARLSELGRALGGPGRPAAVLDAFATEDGVVVELEPGGKPVALVLAVTDAVLAATPGRTVEPLLPLSDETLAQFVSLRLRDTELDVSRVLDTYVETLLEAGDS